ncbi:ankyrin repeat domain-containing protein [Endozoicomonas sp. SM1973]|uniref:Ankyrin repeat domain-containing protein n=1 Tax=Spartinivicinus marinus TaxID=2994442 RepID=A0A853IIN8_9GAMM|nr:ankyrin repeat domain-containing protein [Spartinivicinus marinus]MCX4028403.1 ankyrin repeat domain-containing protein [Spartinivicinus marinus]NYZ67486.1 ankyrin repeat domain-containing protein [Spartinivicinus marinus]
MSIKRMIFRFLKMALTLFLVNNCYGNEQDIIQLSLQGNTTAIQKLLDSSKSNINIKSPNGDTPLLIAARKGNLELFDLLMKHGANINVLDKNNRDILNIAAKNRNPELAKLALSHGIDPTMITSRYQGSALIYASAQGEVEIVTMLLNAKAPVNRINNIGWTALLEAIILGDGSKNYIEIVRHLLAAGADKTIADRSGKTPLIHAKEKGYSEITQLLLK